MKSESTYGIIVIFHPEKKRLAGLMADCRLQGVVPVIVDNGSTASDIYPALDAEVIKPPTNVGIGAAQNLGVALAAGRGASHLLFLDQDSRLLPGCVDALREAFCKLESDTIKPAAVGPVIVDAATGFEAPFARFGLRGVTRLAARDSRQSVRADFLVASGMFTSVERFAQVGPWEEGIFIDNVDFEWCFRAKSKGYCCYGVPRARLDHSIGDSATHLKLGVRRARIAIHGPSRQYYIMRNRIHMYKRPYVPVAWKLQDLPRAIFKTIYFSTCVEPRWQNFKAIAAGARDGLANVYGPLKVRSPATTGGLIMTGGLALGAQARDRDCDS